MRRRNSEEVVYANRRWAANRSSRRGVSLARRAAASGCVCSGAKGNACAGAVSSGQAARIGRWIFKSEARWRVWYLIEGYDRAD
ncbi:hypothetical protein BRN76_05815, partial [Xanthomonas oryzae pv. oryzae]